MLSVEQVMGGVLFFTHAVARCVLGSHLAAHIFPQWLGFFVLAANGVNAWFVQGAWRLLTTVPGVRAYNAGGELAATLMIPFQLYETVCALGVKRLRGRHNEMLAHHVLALTLSWMCVRHGMYFYYSAYFMGVSEVSSLPLVLVDAFKTLKHLEPRFPKLSEAMKLTFAFCFLALRSVYWPVVSYYFWQASLRHEGDSLEVAFFLTVNTILSAMQAYWTMLILDGVKNIVKGTAAHKQNGKDV